MIDAEILNETPHETIYVPRGAPKWNLCHVIIIHGDGNH